MSINIKPSGRSISAEDLLKQTQSNIENHLPKTSTINNDRSEEERRTAKFYLPVLRLNDPTQWESKPASERKHFTDEEAKKTCVGNCCNVAGLKAACCQLDPDDLEHVLGPVDQKWINDALKWFRKQGLPYTRHDLVIDYEEGKLIGEAHFNGHEIFKKKDTYPILRIQASGIRYACKFLNVSNGMCTIYKIRPDMCRTYLCSYVKSNFLIRTPSHPNTYKMIK